MKLDHLGKEQLTYLEGMVEKCAAAGIDPAVVMKMAADIWGEVGKGLKETGNEITQGISETAPMQWLGGAGDAGDPRQFEPLDAHNKQLGKYRQLSQQADDPVAAKKLKPMELAQGKYYKGMLTDPQFQAAAGKDFGPRGMSKVWRALGGLNPFGRRERETRYGAENALDRARAQTQAIMAYKSKNPFRAPAPSQAYAKPMAIPGLQYTAYNEPYNFGARYNAA